MSRKIFVLKRTAIIISLNLVGLSVSNFAHAVADFGNPGVLPVGRHQVTFRFGQVSEIQDKFNDNGTLQSPGRMNKRMDNAFLMKQKEFREFAKILDEQILPNQKPSKDIDLGAVEFKGDATVDYFAPQIARGMTSNWSLGIAIPMVRYQSDINAQNVGVNTFVNISKGMADPNKVAQMDAKSGRQVQAMVGGPKEVMRDKLESRNYKSVSGRDEQFVGDIVLGSSLKFFDTKNIDLYLLNQLTLPTGPKDDPDDLLDLNIFGKTALQTTLFSNFELRSWVELGAGVFYTWGIPDDFDKRVPTSESDDIPEASTKETVRKDPGDSFGALLYSNFKLSDYYHIGAGYETGRSQSDKYTGGKGSRYDLLEKNTDKTYGIAKFKFTYSAVDGFMKGEEKIPYSVTYAFSDHVHGKNVERELTHELLLKFYF